MSDTLTLETAIRRSARVSQVEGMFDVKPSKRSVVEIEVPDELRAVAGGHGERSWSVGLIVGPSGSGKSSVARHLWPERFAAEPEWRDDRALVDDFPTPIKETVKLLTSVGLGSPPAWLRPFAKLSTGEQFRASVARVLADTDDDLLPWPPMVIDEFTSTVDRRVAQIGSAAVARTVRDRRQKLVAVTCHFDVIDWLQPDWVYRPDAVDFEWRRLQRRPSLDFYVAPVHRSAWRLFRHHHYLSGSLHNAAKCFCAFDRATDEPVAFSSYIHFAHPRVRDIKMSHRTVVLPDYQGLGLGGALTEFVGQRLHEQGYRFHATLAHPALIAHRLKSPRWRSLGRSKGPSSSKTIAARLVSTHTDPRKLATVSFAYVPED
jgi:GNAT superfamily N-acetyltransferase